MKKTRCFGINPKNPAQESAISGLLNPEIDLVILEGTAGSGKTLLALAAGLEQVMETRMYKEIIFTRAPVGVGADMGFLPGDETEKLLPWCGALMDNLEYLVGDNKLSMAVVEQKIKIKAMQFMRGRSFMNKWLIIDEAQNLSTAELKVLLTRAGNDTKIIVLGDRSQTDNKKLSKDSNALVDLIGAYEYAPTKYICYVNLPIGERSQICNWAALNL